MTSRRLFLTGSAAVVAGCRFDPPDPAASATTPAGTDPDPTPTKDTGTTDTGATDPTDTAPTDPGATECVAEAPPPDCVLTTAGPTGPNYVEDVPERTELCPSDYAGTVLRLRGFVHDEDCNPVADALFDLWHAFPVEAGYDFSPDNLFRGKVRTGADGSFCVLTRVPGYELSGTGSPIPLHIHFRIQAVGYEELITGFDFDDDPALADLDPPPDLVLHPVDDGAGGRVAEMNVVVRRSG